MTDLLTVLPHFDSRLYTHILPSLEKTLISSADLLTLDAVHIAKRAQLPPAEVKKLADALVQALSDELSTQPGRLDEQGKHHFVLSRRGDSLLDQWIISTLDDNLDLALNGGVHSSYLTEITGER